MVKCFSTFETSKSGKIWTIRQLGHVVEIEASRVREIGSSVDRRSGKSIVKTPV
jgi:hypothetical protein